MAAPPGIGPHVMKRLFLLMPVLMLLGALVWWGDQGRGHLQGAQVAPPQAESKVPAGQPVRVLFVGNSLTASNDLPAVVQAMAASGGKKLEYEASTLPGAGLEDHWNSGNGRRLLASGKWHFVVLQQGPSSLPQSQLNLRQWSIRWAEVARKSGARSALYMVWPMKGQRDGFELVAQSYRSAARASDSLLLPAGEAWRELRRDAAAPALYLPDRIHPTVAGTYLAALVITERLTGVKASTVPSRLRLAGGRLLALPDQQVHLLQQAATKAIENDAAAAGKGKRPG
jgi:hypothetical protein